TGLLLFTTDGELANRLMHPSYEMDREYAVRVRGEVTEEMIERLLNGVMLEDGPAKFSDIQQAPGGEGFNHWYHCVVMEGRNREVRRLWESQGLVVSRLKRVRFGPVFLTSELTMGRYREMDQREIDILSEEVGLKPVALPGMTTKAREKAERQQRKQARPLARSERPEAGRKRAPRREDGENAARRVPASRPARGPQPNTERKGREQGTPVAERPRESNRKPRPSKPRDERPASAPGDKPVARKPQVKRRPKPAGDGMRPGFRR
ncbi:pseudouridine synthase, partial [Pseudomonas aeruginosa]